MKELNPFPKKQHLKQMDTLPLKHIEWLMTLNEREYDGASFQSLDAMAFSERVMSKKERLYRFLGAVFSDLQSSWQFERLAPYPLVQQHIQACITHMIASEMLMRRYDYFVCYRIVGDKILSYELNSFLLYLLHNTFSNASTVMHGVPPLICTPSLRDNNYPLNMQSLLAFFDKRKIQQQQQEQSKKQQQQQQIQDKQMHQESESESEDDDDDSFAFENAIPRESTTDMHQVIQLSVIAANCSLRVTDARQSHYFKYARGLSHECEAPPTTFVNGYGSAAVDWVSQCVSDLQLVFNITCRKAESLIAELLQFYQTMLAPQRETQGHLLQICLPRVGGLDLEEYAYLSLAWGSPVHVWEKNTGAFEIRSVYDDVDTLTRAGCIRRVPMAEVLHMPEMSAVQLRLIAHPNLFLQHGVCVGNLESGSEHYDRAVLFRFLRELLRPYYTVNIKPIHWSRWMRRSP